MSLTFTLDSRQVELLVDEELAPRDAILGAAYLFIDRCYVFLSRADDKKVQVRLRLKIGAEASESALEAMAGEFANELLNQTLRFRVGESTRRLREYTMARAFFSGTSTTSIDKLLAELDAEDLEADSLEIKVPWNENG